MRQNTVHGLVLTAFTFMSITIALQGMLLIAQADMTQQQIQHLIILIIRRKVETHGTRIANQDVLF